MDDSAFGRQDARGPPRPRALAKWLFGFPGYFLPWNVFYAILALLIWQFLTPSLDTIKDPAIGWIAMILGRNILLAIAVYGAWHLWLYSWRKQGTAFKYNRQWPRDRAAGFLFGNQTYDNMFHTLVSGVPIWTIYECLLLWAYANGIAPMISFADHPVGFIALFFLVPFIHEVGFYFAHRLLHYPFLYDVAHKLHHRNINPGPWSGLSMHPIEHLIYFSTILLFFFIPSHPVHMINLASRLGVSPAQGHTGFDRVVVGQETTVEASYYAHYLHHKYFEVNYSDGMVPLDKWFGSFHDGTPEAHEAMKERRMRRGSA
jgi:sterol desaturase/sphingolipid hydroxylase (fatty acid hydroxylase superfamily)